MYDESKLSTRQIPSFSRSCCQTSGGSTCGGFLYIGGIICEMTKPLCTGQFQYTVSADSMSRTKRIQDVCLEEHLGPNMAQLGTLFHPDIGSFHVRRFRPFGSLCHPGRVRRQVTFEFWSERVAHHCRRQALTSRKRVARQLSLAAL